MILAIAPTAIAPAAAVATTFDRLLAASELAGADGRVVLHRADIDTALREMMSKLVVRTTDVSAVDYGYAPSPASAVKRREPPGTEALLKPRDVAEALERHRASAFSDAIVEEIARERRGKVDSKVLGLMMKHVRAHAYAEEEDERRPGGTLRVGRW